MLPVVTEATVTEIVTRRRIFAVEEIRRDYDALTRENPEIALFIAVVWRVLSEKLREVGFVAEAADELGLIGVDLSLMLYSCLRTQAERDRLPPLPRPSHALVETFVRRLGEFIARPPHELMRTLERNPNLLRLMMMGTESYLFTLQVEAERERLPAEARGRLPLIAYGAFGCACGIYELLEEAEIVQELTRFAR